MSAPVVLFASAKHEPHPRAVWDPTTFANIDDTVRGGSSSSSMTLKDASRGIDFSGFLDTTTLGGAGFASQAYSENGRGFPGNVLDKDKFSGLQLVIESPFIKDLVGGTEKQQPGGGKHPVTAYVLNLKTETPQKRPDGRNESTIVYEWAFNMTQEGPMSLEAKWNEFKPKYRGRPADDAKLLDPSEVREMSFMARSNFAVSEVGVLSPPRSSDAAHALPLQEQSGPFSLRLVSLSALPVSQLQGRRMGSEARQDAVHLSSPAGVSGSGEYYGFALFIVATVVMALWIVWALVPDWLLQRVGVDWYPNRYVQLADG